MTKTYTRQQIAEAISYWENYLRRLDENDSQKALSESVVNKILSWVGLRSNYTELEDLVDDIANKKIKTPRMLLSKIQHFARKLMNDNKELRKMNLPKREFDETDIIPILKKVLQKKMGSKIKDTRYIKAINMIAKSIYIDVSGHKEKMKQLNAEIEASLSKEREAEKKKREAEYWQKHGTGYADINKHRGNDSFYEPAQGGHYTGKSRKYD